MKFPLLKRTDKNLSDTSRQREGSAELEQLLSECKKQFKNPDIGLISKAFDWCYRIHKDKVRPSGEPFYLHPVAVAHIVVTEIPLDDISVAAALLHNIGSHYDYDQKELAREFGNTIAEIIDGISKIRNIENRKTDVTVRYESYQRLLLSMFTDIRIILIKLADRLHNMRNLESFPDNFQKSYASETLEIYSPFANRFGLGNIKWEIEDYAFKYTDRVHYNEISEYIQLSRADREQYVRDFEAIVHERLDKEQFLKKNNIKFEISGRPKHIYSIYNKTIIRGLPIEELNDLFAIRIIVDSNDQNICFYFYGLVCEIFPPVPNTFKNYISTSKNNGYKSIHSAVVGPDNKRVEVQIRTREMHNISEQGIAAHFRYKPGLVPVDTVFRDKNIQEWMDNVREIFENIGDSTPQQLIESVKINLFQEEIYVFTPKKELRRIARDSTPLDFAFAIHSEIGIKCIGAKVNSRIVPLDWKLQSGDQVEILTSDTHKPNADVFKLLVTPKAKSTLMKYFKDEAKKLENQGRDLWEEFCYKQGLRYTDEQFENLLEFLSISEKPEFYRGLANGALNTEDMLSFLKKKSKKKFKDNGTNHNDDAVYEEVLISMPNGTVEASYAECCNPIPGDRIKAERTKNSELIIHQDKCPDLIRMSKDSSLIFHDIDWAVLVPNKFFIEIKLVCIDRPSLLNDLSAAIFSCDNTNIRGLSFDTKDSIFEGHISIEVLNINHLRRVFTVLKSVNGVRSVSRLKNFN